MERCPKKYKQKHRIRFLLKYTIKYLCSSQLYKNIENYICVLYICVHILFTDICEYTYRYGLHVYWLWSIFLFRIFKCWLDVCINKNFTLHCCCLKSSCEEDVLKWSFVVRMIWEKYYMSKQIADQDGMHWFQGNKWGPEKKFQIK